MSDPNPANRALVTRLLFGVTSVGAALGLLYLYYNSQQKKKDSEADPNNAAAAAKRKRRVGSGNGERNRVTFADQNEIIETPSLKVEFEAYAEDALGKRGVDKKSPDKMLLLGPAAAKDLSQPVVVGASTVGSSSSVTTVSSPESDAIKVKVESSKEEEVVVVADQDSDSSLESSDASDQVAGEERISASVVTKNDADAGSPQEKGSLGVTVKVETDGPVAGGVVEEPVVVVASNGHNLAAAPVGTEPMLNSAITPETDYENSSKIKHLMIPRDLVPGLIGKKGARIKQIQATSNTVVNFQDETLENGDRICVIRGLPQDVTLAESMIEKFILEQPMVTNHTMSIPHSCVGRIIGKGGESIRMIQDLSKAKVTVDSPNHFHRGGGDGGSARNVFIRGTDEQIELARQMILSKVEEEQTLRRNIDIATQQRTPRRPTSVSSSNSPGGPSSMNPDLSGVNGNSLPLKTNGEMEVFVSCAYHPNDFWIQIMGRESIELDKLTDSMTEWYTQLQMAGAASTNPLDNEFDVGDIIAAPFDVDSKMYRGKILKIENDSYEVIYVDYGDKRTLRKEELQKIHPEFLKLRFQAMQATLNLGCIGERWMDEAINEFCDLTYCAQWQALRAKVKAFLKDPNDHRDIICVELFDQDSHNIGDELVRRGLANPHNESSATSGIVGVASSSSSNSKKSYAAVVADEIKTSSASTSDAVQDGVNHEEVWDDTYNGN